MDEPLEVEHGGASSKNQLDGAATRKKNASARVVQWIKTYRRPQKKRRQPKIL